MLTKLLRTKNGASASVRRNVIFAPDRTTIGTSTVPRSAHVGAIALTPTLIVVAPGDTLNGVFGAHVTVFVESRHVARHSDNAPRSTVTVALVTTSPSAPMTKSH